MSRKFATERTWPGEITYTPTDEGRRFLAVVPERLQNPPSADPAGGSDPLCHGLRWRARRAASAQLAHLDSRGVGVDTTPRDSMSQRLRSARSAVRGTLRTSGEAFVHHPPAALRAGVALVGLVVLIGLVIPTQPLEIDKTWSEWMSDIPSSALHHLALIFNYLGRGLGRTLTLVALGLVLLIARRWVALLAFAATESLTPLTSNLLKHLADRPRPPNAMLHANGSSFPSGHAAYAGATAIALVLLLRKPGHDRRVWWAIAAAAIAGMCWSRTYLQVHWLSDVIAGALLGIGITLTSFAGVQLLAPPRPNDPPEPWDAADTRLDEQDEPGRPLPAREDNG
jgi:undecaprenyl-diphosphatase